MKTTSSDFVEVHGVRLHYLDWSGAGPALLFLTGMECSAYNSNARAARQRGRNPEWTSFLFPKNRKKSFVTR